MDPTYDLNVRSIRDELGLSQGDLAALVGVSTRAIQSYEQRWRQPSEMVQRALMLILIARRNGRDLTSRKCWEHKECAPDVRRQCIAYVTRQGHLCWFLTGTLCEGQNMRTWKAKWEECLKCDFCHSLLAGASEGGDEELRKSAASQTAMPADD